MTWPGRMPVRGAGSVPVGRPFLLSALA
jgi:hypothetical protein